MLRVSDSDSNSREPSQTAPVIQGYLMEKEDFGDRVNS